MDPKVRESLAFVQGKMVDVSTAAGLNISLRFPVSLLLLDGDVDTYSPLRGGAINHESAEHSVIEVAGVLGCSSPSDGYKWMVLALVPVFVRIAAEKTSDDGNDDGEVAHGQGDSVLEGTNDGLPNAGTKDQDGVGEGDKSGDQGTSKNGHQPEANSRTDVDLPENPEGSSDQDNIGDCLG